MERTTADYMGMLATVINGLALQSALEQMGLPTRVQTAIQMDNVAEPFIRRRAIDQLEDGKIVIFVAGTGNPFFSTDTTAALRANEIGAEVILKATKVDGIYTADPFKDPKATKYDRITYTEALSKRLSVMDSTAFSLCMDNKMPIIVFDMMKSDNIKRVVLGQAGRHAGHLRITHFMDPDEILLDTEAAMEKGFEYMQHEFSAVRTGKASPALVENIDVEAYGSSMKLKQLALITTPEPRLLVIQPFDASTTKDIEKAIKESKLGINPAVDGKIIRLPIPALSEERRKDLVKGIKQMAEEARVRVRSARREGIDAIKKAQKDGSVTEDELETYEKEIQKLTDRLREKNRRRRHHQGSRNPQSLIDLCAQFSSPLSSSSALATAHAAVVRLAPDFTFPGAGERRVAEKPPRPARRARHRQVAEEPATSRRRSRI